MPTILRGFSCFLLALAPLTVQTAAGQTVVALDGYHNNESKMPDHYQWDGTRMGGFSELAKLLRDNGADELRTLRSRIDADSLKGVSLLIIVDPDTPSETADPKYIEDSEIDAIARWVDGGGQLVLLGNDKGNAEFEHLNRLAGRFGIQFLEETYPKVEGKGILIASGTHPIFDGSLNVYLVEVAPLKLTGKAEPILVDHDVNIMALAQYGKGRVFAVGDPWIYNEYIDRNGNRQIATRLFRLLLARQR
jgi:unsaturated rhamnogalacturonyl hydrolase